MTFEFLSLSDQLSYVLLFVTCFLCGVLVGKL